MIEDTSGIEYTLTHLIDSVQSAVKILKGPAKSQLDQQLHDSTKLPHKRIASLASQAIDILNEAERLLEPGPLTLADHFLGIILCKCCRCTKI